MDNELLIEPLPLDEYTNKQVVIEKIDANHSMILGNLEHQLNMQEANPTCADIPPIIKYVALLKDLRKKSQLIKSYFDEINYSHTVEKQFKSLTEELKLPPNHFLIDNSGDPLLIKEGKGEHIISPTHFENGAYFSHPHADHHLLLNANELPRIKIGKYVRFGKNAALNAGGNVTIGNGVWLSPGSYLLKQDHDPFGRPSVFSRTVAMTKLSSIMVADYAWIGRDALVGWDSDYIGKCSIIATRSFLNSWVGDYSITGMYGRIIQYFPYKAAIMEFSELEIENILRISDWESLNDHWLKQFKKVIRENLLVISDPFPTIKNLLQEQGRKGSKILDMNPGYGDNIVFASVNGFHVDGVSDKRTFFPFILQRLQNSGSFNARLRGDVDNTNLPFPKASIKSFNNKKIGYDIVINTNINQSISSTQLRLQLKEATRVCNAGGYIIFGILDDYNFSNLIQYAENLGLKLVNNSIEKKNNELRQHFVKFYKVDCSGVIN